MNFAVGRKERIKCRKWSGAKIETDLCITIKLGNIFVRNTMKSDTADKQFLEACLDDLDYNENENNAI